METHAHGGMPSWEPQHCGQAESQSGRAGAARPSPAAPGAVRLRMAVRSVVAGVATEGSVVKLYALLPSGRTCWQRHRCPPSLSWSGPPDAEQWQQKYSDAGSPGRALEDQQRVPTCW